MSASLSQRLRAVPMQIAILLLIAAASLVYFYVTYVYRPALEPAEATRAHVEALQAANTQVRGSIAAYGLPRLKARIASYRAMRGDLERLIPPSDSVLDVLGMLDRAAARAGVTVAGVHPESSTVAGAYFKRGWAITAVGSAERMGLFLTALGNETHIVRPQRLTMTPISRKDVDGRAAGDPRTLVHAAFSLETVWNATLLDTAVPVEATAAPVSSGGLPTAGPLQPAAVETPTASVSPRGRPMGGYSPVDSGRTP